jgi:hypothetical protein
LVTDVLRWLGPLLIEGGIIGLRHLQHHGSTFLCLHGIKLFGYFCP